jgi:hypothetical protein
MKFQPSPSALGGLALTNPILGIALTKKQRQAKAVGKAALWRNKYLNCRGKMEKKGKPSYPDDESSKKCRGQYKKWNKHRGKAGKRAEKLMAGFEKKGKMTAAAKLELTSDIKRAEQEAVQDVRTSSGVSMEKSEDMLYDGDFPEGDFDEDGYPIEEAGTPVWVLPVVGVAVIGILSLGIMALRK